jgi:hypothetical protein
MIVSVFDKTQNGYVPEVDLDNVEYRMALLLYSIGMDGSAIDDYPIEDVIDQINVCFHYRQNLWPRHKPAYGSYFTKMSHALKISYRRLYGARAEITGAVENV